MLHQAVLIVSTPSRDSGVVHCGVADDSEIRRENFRRWCHSLAPDGIFSPTLVAQRLGKTPSQWSDLYHARKSFGEKLARSIEEAAGLTRMSLDEPDVALRPAALSRETQEALSRQPFAERVRVENALRALLGLPPLDGLPHAGGSFGKQRRAGA